MICQLLVPVISEQKSQRLRNGWAAGEKVCLSSPQRERAGGGKTQACRKPSGHTPQRVWSHHGARKLCEQLRCDAVRRERELQRMDTNSIGTFPAPVHPFDDEEEATNGSSICRQHCDNFLRNTKIKYIPHAPIYDDLLAARINLPEPRTWRQNRP